MKRDQNRIRLIFLIFGMYFLTGVVCMVLGTSLSSLSELYRTPVQKTVLLGTWFAIGRVSTVYVTSKFVEKYGPLKVLFIGVLSICLYMMGIIAFKNYYISIPLAFLAGFGMGIQDTVCPLLTSAVYPKNYSSALSAGQAFFGSGGFCLSLLIGFLLSKSIPFYVAYLILSSVGIVMLVIIPFTYFQRNGSSDNLETVKPLVTNKPKTMFLIVLLICFVYCSVVNSIGLYTTSYLESIGLEASNAAYSFTLYNVGCLTGSIIFVEILKHLSEKQVLVMNSAGSLIAMLIVNNTRLPIVFTGALFISGFFLGNLFSVILAIATRIEYTQISVASSEIAMAGGFGDIVTPLWTSQILKSFGIKFTYSSIVFQILLLFIVSFCLLIFAKEKNYGNSK